MRALFLISAFLAMTSAGAPQAAAQPETHPTYKGVTAEEAVGIVFSEIEKRVIRDYYAKQTEAAGGKDKSKKMPPGLAKRDELPPGLQQQIVRNGTLPPGLAKRDLPSDLVLELPATKKGTERKIVGSDVVLIQTATGIILDVLENVVTAN